MMSPKITMVENDQGLKRTLPWVFP